MKIEKNYCSCCDRETAHSITTEDGVGVSGAGRILSTIFTAGMSNLYCETYIRCLTCGKERRIK